MKEENEPLDLVKLFYQQDIDFETLEKALSKRKTTAKNFTSYSLDPFDGDFGYNEKRHLLNRSIVGYATRHMDDLNGLDIDQTIDLIFTPEELAEPRNIYYQDLNSEEYRNLFLTEDVGPNQPFINRPYRHHSLGSDEEFGHERVISLMSIIYRGMYDQSTSIHWKLFVFLHNLVPTYPYDRNGHKGMYNYTKLLFESCFSSYKDFIYNITINESMLFYLNLGLSKKETPDENYAREIQELFTQGKRPFSGFSESDVREIARALVGWNYGEDWRYSEGHENPTVFDPNNHDTGDKYFSSYYNNRIIRGRSGQEGREELREVVDMLFETNKSAIYILTRLYQFFVYPTITDEILSEIIEPLAQVFRDTNYSLVEPLKILLKSKHFFSSQIPNSIIKSPLDFEMGMMKEVDIKNGILYHHFNDERFIYGDLEPSFFESKEKDPSYIEYMMSQRLFNDGKELGMRLLWPPSVSGWQPFYQSPAYDMFWFNSSTSKSRAKICRNLLFPGMWLNVVKDSGEVNLAPNFKEYIRNFENRNSVDSILSQLLDRFINVAISENTKTRLKESLLGGNSEIHWVEAMDNFYSESPDMNLYHNTTRRIGLTIASITILGEFQLH